ncbi:MAG TPA: LPXTG cell wall anchor domain-containing protein [Candidatus Hydrogenedens sp.]|nr:LPXTG cell wall anchor domain-containing protein [Candidatus Hydrogenedens sp.]
MWPGNPEIPVGSIAIIGAISGVIVAGSSLILVRRRKQA